MILQKAIDKMEIGDSISRSTNTTENIFTYDFLKEGSKRIEKLSVDDVMATDWQIIKKKQEPVTAEEIWNAHLKCVEDGILSRELEKADFLEIWKICESNTHLLYAELMEELHRFKDGPMDERSANQCRVFHVLAKMKQNQGTQCK
jgi:hypothetical protein